MSLRQRTSENQPGLFNRDATAADLVNDLAEVKCPLGCQERPRFQGKRNRLLRFECGECHLVFEMMPTSPKPPMRPERGGSTS